MAKTPKNAAAEPVATTPNTLYRMFCPVAEGSNEMVLVGEADTIEALVIPDGPYQIEIVVTGAAYSSVCVTYDPDLDMQL